ncbi:MAG: UDP-glucose/GDP-mannose dehydrogenase family protein [Ignavibacteria bacterium]|nr:UDP-glucose/GDP-mannose dehydrogenase family protein [Ignavibacteria bacterium]MCU7504304.1 UDP-glucose/GDP-mannose dehydrogenase family protein [Ignavibacteria bacterium]MCU7516149.1 UDP-glucose/GDP-mannose dehydrogenase family protein [Ignavibacteria bacterium]
MNLAVIGTGYVGLVSGTCFAEMGNQVICVDNNQEKLSKLQSAEVTIYEPGLDFIFYRNIAKKRLSFTDDLKYAVNSSEIIFLCLPTPQGEDGSADLKYVFGIAGEIGKILKESGDRDYKVIVNKSTVPVGTAVQVAGILKNFGLKNFDIVSNPEFLREGFAVEDFMKPDRIVIGSDSVAALEKMKLLYEPFVRQGNPILEMDTSSAEVTKYAANSYLAMRITYMNELANFCEKVGANVDMVRKGMGTDSRIGKRFLFAGIGYGGSCFPKDVNALIKTSCDYDSEMKILTVVDKVNHAQKLVLVEKVLSYFNNDIKEKHFAVWGLAFKPNTDDMREAPSVVLIKKLLELGASVSAYDPAAIETAKFYLNNSVTYAENEYDALRNAEALIIVTEWNEFRNPDFSILKSTLKQPVIFDGRNIFTPEKMQELGFTYYSIGRKPANV